MSNNSSGTSQEKGVAPAAPHVSSVRSIVIGRPLAMTPLLLCCCCTVRLASGLHKVTVLSCEGRPPASSYSRSDTACSAQQTYAR